MTRQSLPTLYESATVRVIDKPAGLPVCAVRGFAGDSVASRLPEWHAVHRLDNDTSGCLLLARDAATLAALRQQFAAQTIEKVYVALVHGLAPATATIEHAIGHHPTNRRRMVMAHAGQKIRGAPQAAQSQLTMVEQIPLHPQFGPLSCVQVRITTGVRHQIRVHLASLGLPIVGDPLYSKYPAPGVTHHLLHAWRLGFVDPTSGERTTVTAPLPKIFSSIFP